MSVALSFIGGTGSFAKLRMNLKFKKWMSIGLAFAFHSFTPLCTGSAHLLTVCA